MINLILTFILLILVILLFVKKEKFISSYCKFIPRGRTKGQCLDICKNPEFKQFYETDKDACSTEECVKLCNNCNSNELCHWINPYTKSNINKEEAVRTNEIELSSKIEDNLVILNWKWINSYISLSPLENNYVIVFKEVNTNINNASIVETNLKTYSFVLEDDNTSLPLLKKNTEYLFVVYSTNKVRRNGISNLINVKT
tara:strand:- start:2283 stop:2882 length:600 start_codon:yes stop_codon:yes gene_type:complete